MRGPQIRAVGVRADDPGARTCVCPFCPAFPPPEARTDGEVPAVLSANDPAAQLAVSAPSPASATVSADGETATGDASVAQAVCRGRHACMSSITGIAGTLGSWLCLLSHPQPVLARDSGRVFLVATVGAAGDGAHYTVEDLGLVRAISDPTKRCPWSSIGSDAWDPIRRTSTWKLHPFSRRADHGIPPSNSGDLFVPHRAETMDGNCFGWLAFSSRWAMR